MYCMLCGVKKRYYDRSHIEQQATVQVIYGLYSAYAQGYPHQVLELCCGCLKHLWEGELGGVPLEGLVTAGLCHFSLETLSDGNGNESGNAATGDNGGGGDGL